MTRFFFNGAFFFAILSLSFSACYKSSDMLDKPEFDSSDTGGESESDTHSDGSTYLNGFVGIDISAGGFHTCGLKTDGTARCWGEDDFGQSTPPSGIFEQISAGGSHTCGVKTDGTIACWGLDNYSQSTPPSGTFEQVSGGGFHTCGVTTEHTVLCWGAEPRSGSIG